MNLHQLSPVKSNQKAGSLTVGGGTIFSNIVNDVYKAGYQMCE